MLAHLRLATEALERHRLGIMNGVTQHINVNHSVGHVGGVTEVAENGDNPN